LRTGKVVKEIFLPFCPDLAGPSTESQFAACYHSANGASILQQSASYLNLG
jgi:hypothetical protein